MVSKIVLKSVARIETGELDTGAETDNTTALQTVTDDLVDEFDTTSGHYHDGSDSKEIPAANIVVTPPLWGWDQVYGVMQEHHDRLADASDDDRLYLSQRGTDPTEPEEGKFVVWMSDGTGKGDAGDVLIASKTGGVTKWATLFDHSAGGAW